jgi:6-phosphogluconolactonase
MGTGEVRIFAEKGEMLAFMLARWRDVASAAIASKGQFTAALSGGRTPRDFFFLLSHLQPELWAETHIFLVDERCVPLDSPDSNYAMIRSSLLSSISLPSENIHPVPVDPDDASASATKYEEELRYFFRLSAGSLPAFDLVHLGVGADGHTASLFPGTPALDETLRLTSEVLLGESKHNRITLTLPVINNAENIMMLVTGGDKADIMKRVIAQQDRSLPAALVRPRGKLLYVLDNEAASELSADFR